MLVFVGDVSFLTDDFRFSLWTNSLNRTVVQIRDLGPVHLSRKSILVCLRHWPDEQRRIEARFEPVDSPIQVRAGNSPGRADRPENIAACDVVADRDRYLRQVRIDRRQSVAVINHDRATGEEQTGFG